MTGSTDHSGDHPADPIYALGFHASFACRQSGMCCQSGAVNIQVEAPEQQGILAALNGGRLAYPPGLTKPGQIFKSERSAGLAPTSPSPTSQVLNTPGAPAFLRAMDSGFCVFMDPEHGNDCQIHAQLGPEMLPRVCRSFPRSSTRGSEGTSVSLALSCPTAVAMLFEGSGPFAVVTDPPRPRS